MIMISSKRPSQNKALERAIACFESLSDMARQLGLSGYQVIQHWRDAGRVPPDHCTLLAQLTGESREDLIGWPPMECKSRTDLAAASDDTQPPVGTASDELEDTTAGAHSTIIFKPTPE